jgi:hypothetical protein
MGHKNVVEPDQELERPRLEEAFTQPPARVDQEPLGAGLDEDTRSIPLE